MWSSKPIKNDNVEEIHRDINASNDEILCESTGYNIANNTNRKDRKKNVYFISLLFQLLY